MNDIPEPELPPPPASNYQPARATGSRRATAALFAMTLLAGMVGGAWMMKRFGPETPMMVAGSEAATGEVQASDAAASAAATASAANAPPAGSDTITAFESSRIAALEQRMAEINLQARANGAASESRAEALMVAFAARRAVERGQSLGYIEEELRQRFGATMPRAVSTILDAASRRVTADKLRERLEQLEPALMAHEGSAANIWSNITNLFVVRSENAPLLDPAQRMARAKRALDLGRVDRAIAEVEKMPGAAKAADWLVTARQFSEAQQALDLVEAAAIQGSQNLRDINAAAPLSAPVSAPPGQAAAPGRPESPPPAR